jgi:hypothetical protein
MVLFEAGPPLFKMRNTSMPCLVKFIPENSLKVQKFWSDHEWGPALCDGSKGACTPRTGSTLKIAFDSEIMLTWHNTNSNKITGAPINIGTQYFDYRPDSHCNPIGRERWNMWLENALLPPWAEYDKFIEIGIRNQTAIKTPFGLLIPFSTVIDGRHFIWPGRPTKIVLYAGSSIADSTFCLGQDLSKFGSIMVSENLTYFFPYG